MITDLLRANAPNPASVLKLSFTPLGAVVGWPEPIGGQFSSALTFVNGWRWFDIYGTPQTISFHEEIKKDRGRVYYEVDAAAFLPGDSAAFRAQLQWMAYTKFYVKVKDQLGLMRVAGRPGQGLDLFGDFNNEAEMGGKRGYNIRFVGKVSLPAGIYPF
jgi:hypothetical protein